MEYRLLRAHAPGGRPMDLCSRAFGPCNRRTRAVRRASAALRSSVLHRARFSVWPASRRSNSSCSVVCDIEVIAFRRRVVTTDHLNCGGSRNTELHFSARVTSDKTRIEHNETASVTGRSLSIPCFHIFPSPLARYPFAGVVLLYGVGAQAAA